MAANTHASLPTVEQFKILSIECFYDYLRFESFQNFTELQRKQLIKTALKVPLKNGETMNHLFKFIKEENLEDALAYLGDNQLKDLPPTNKNVEGMIDAYFSESKRSRALKFLRFLMYFPPNQATAYDKFIESYISAKPEERDNMLPSVMYNAYTL